MPQATDQSERENASPPMRLMARQPIFDAQEKLVAYELLARRGALDTDEKQDYATSDIIEQIANLGGLGPITDNHPAFINLTREALLSEQYTVLPKGRVVYELLEHVTPDREVIQACKKLGAKGYRLALDDVVDLDAIRPLLEQAHMVKVDFALSDAGQQERLMHELRQRQLTLLAEKIETRAQFERAHEMGFHRFQGFFYEKPQIISRGDVSPSVAAYIRLLSEITRETVDFDAVESIFKGDLSLSTRLLRYLRTHADLVSEVSSIKQAVLLLGEEPLRRWAAVLGVTVLGEDKPHQLVVQSLLRARFCELMAQPLGRKRQEEEFFLLGLLSLLDTLTQRPLDDVLLGMPVSYDVRVGLLGGKTLMGRTLSVLRACERGDHATLTHLADKLALTAGEVYRRYHQAVAWADSITSRRAA
ncbi:MAG: EAL and HDOD domain-containing protein [Phycisphaeraceae bacterium]